MNKTFSIKYSKDYRDDLKSAVKYIRTNLQNPIAAKNLKNDVIEKINGIIDNPFAYPVISDEYLVLKGYRFALVKNYMMFFKIIEKQIEIIRFLYGPMDWMNILRDEN